MSNTKIPAGVVSAGMVFAVASGALEAAAPPNYPNKPVRLIAANSAGGGLDIVARSIGPKLAAVFGYQVVVDNRAGAAGSLASEITAHALPDGHTVMVGSLGGLAVNTNLYKGLKYHPLRDLTRSPCDIASNVLVVNPPCRPNRPGIDRVGPRAPGKLITGRRARANGPPRGGAVQDHDQDGHGSRPI